MQDDDLRSSDNIEDRRGSPGGGSGGGGSGGGFRLGGGKLGIGTIVVLGLLGWAFGIDPRLLIGGAEMLAGGSGPAVTQPTAIRPSPIQPGAPNDPIGNFVARVLGETEDVWTQLLPLQANAQYQKPTLVLFSGATPSACGTAQSAMGPFYCPVDRKVYLDTSFFQDMQRRFGGGGDFAYAYVIAHEIGHHVQNLLAILPRVQQQQRQADRVTANELSVRTELMADCLAGVWANRMNARHGNIDANDVRQAVTAATAIGDDRLQKQSQGNVVPDSFTHGSSEQRVRWLITGLKSGDLRACNTLQAAQL